MSDLAGKEAFKKAPERRYIERDVECIGRVRIRSLKTSEYNRIEGMLSRAAIALTGKKPSEGNRLLMEAKVALVTACLVRSDNSPLLDSSDADTLRNLDYGVLSDIEEACEKHCGLTGLDVEAAAKNSSSTDADDSP